MSTGGSPTSDHCSGVQAGIGTLTRTCHKRFQCQDARLADHMSHGGSRLRVIRMQIRLRTHSLTQRNPTTTPGRTTLRAPASADPSRTSRVDMRPQAVSLASTNRVWFRFSTRLSPLYAATPSAISTTRIATLVHARACRQADGRDQCRHYSRGDHRSPRLRETSQVRDRSGGARSRRLDSQQKRDHEVGCGHAFDAPREPDDEGAHDGDRARDAPLDEGSDRPGGQHERANRCPIACSTPTRERIIAVRTAGSHSGPRTVGIRRGAVTEGRIRLGTPRRPSRRHSAGRAIGSAPGRRAPSTG